ncbi:MAG: LytR family transcriptional regulator, partial [Actinomycetota bacterium]|nr:LytR family transcriptional regulator [Actinomycetota bacterium]
PSYVEASFATVDRLTQQFLGVEETEGPRGKLEPSGRKRRRPQGDGGLEKAPVDGKAQALQAIQQGAGGQLPVYYPTVRLKGSLFAGPPRYYKVHALDGKWHKSYRMVVRRGQVGEYYGIQGTTWREPPILESPSEDRTIGKRRFELHYDGDRLRIVAWRTRKAVYWVSNTLLQSLTERQMIAIARSTRLP